MTAKRRDAAMLFISFGHYHHESDVRIDVHVCIEGNKIVVICARVIDESVVIYRLCRAA